MRGKDALATIVSFEVVRSLYNKIDIGVRLCTSATKELTYKDTQGIHSYIHLTNSLT